MAKKKKTFFKKTKVKISISQTIILTSIILSACILMLAFSVLFSGQKKTAGKIDSKHSVEKVSEPAKSEKNAVQKKVEKPKKNSSEKKATEKNKSGKNTKSSPAKTPAGNAAPAQAAPARDNSVHTSTSQKEPLHSAPAASVVKPEVPAHDIPVAKPEGKRTVAPSDAPVVKDEPVKNEYSIPQAKNNAQLIFVFDDGGQNLNQLKKYLALPFPVSIAVLPKIAHSAESARLIKNSMHELMLHQPMQALNLSVNPGPGAITPEMDVHSARSLIAENIAELGGVAGFNNHEGSLILENTVLVEAIIEEAENQGVFFLDSKTSAASKAPAVAQEMGTRIYTRDIFLDNVKTRENVMSELLKGLEIANKKGYCIMIGHVWSADLIPAILTELYPVLKEKGYTFSVVSKSKGR